MYRSAPLALLVAATVASSCSYFEGTGGDADTGAPPPPTAATRTAPTKTSSTLASLVPIDAVAYVEAASLQEVDGLLREFSSMADDPMVSAMAKTDMLLPMIAGSGNVELIDRSRPFALAVTLSSAESEPQPVFFVPCLDPEAFAKSMGSLPGAPVPRVEGDYVVIAQSSDYRPGGSPHALATNVPKGQVVARVDLASVIDRVRPMLEGAFAQAGGMAQMQGLGESEAAMLEGVQANSETFLDSAETLEMGFSIERGELDFTLAFTAKEGSELAGFSASGTTHMARLATYLDPEAAFSFCAGADAAFFSERVEPFVEEMLQGTPEGEQVAAFFPIFTSVRRTLGTTFAVSGDLGREGARFTWFCKPRDETSFLELLTGGLHALDGQAPYMSLQGPTRSTVGDVAVTEWSFEVPEAGDELDSERVGRQREEIAEIFGTEELVLRMASNGDHMALVFGGDDDYFQEAVRKLSGNGSAGMNSGLERAVSWVGTANPAFAATFDFAKVTAQAQDLMLRLTELQLGPDSLEGAGIEMPTLPENPVPLTYYGAIEGRTWRIGVVADLVGIAEVARSMEESYQ